MARKPKKPAIVRFHFDDPIYECRIFVCVGGSVDDCDARLDKMWGIERKVVNSLAGRCFLPSTCKDCAVWFPSVPGGGIVAHEAFHLTTHILTRSGLKFVPESEEAWAYHLAWIVRQIAKKVW